MTRTNSAAGVPSVLHTLTAASVGWRVWHAADEGEGAPVWWEPLVGWMVDEAGEVIPVISDGLGMVDDARIDRCFLAITGPGLPVPVLNAAVASSLMGWQRKAGREVRTVGVADVVVAALEAAR